MLQMCAEAAVVLEGVQCRVHAGMFGVFCGGAEITVEHQLWRQK